MRYMRAIERFDSFMKENGEPFTVKTGVLVRVDQHTGKELESIDIANLLDDIDQQEKLASSSS